MMQQQRAVGSFADYQTAESALTELKASGFTMAQVSLIGRDLDGQPTDTGAKTTADITELGDLHSDDERPKEAAKNGAIAGTAFGSLTGLLVGVSSLALPGVGPLMLVGATATALATAASGGAIGAAAGGLVGGLIGLGIPDEHANIYGGRVAAGNYLVIVEGSAAEIARAAATLTECGIQDWYVIEPDRHPAPMAGSGSPQ
jgi:hypothetical protein